MAVHLEGEVIFGQVLNERTLLVADDDGEVDESRIDGKGRSSRGRRGRNRTRCCRCLLREGL
jgi:hypothetical protein